MTRANWLLCVSAASRSGKPTAMYNGSGYFGGDRSSVGGDFCTYYFSVPSRSRLIKSSVGAGDGGALHGDVGTIELLGIQK